MHTASPTATTLSGLSAKIKSIGNRCEREVKLGKTRSGGETVTK